jgi:hypothetical protein
MTMDQLFPAQDVPESEVHGPVPMPVSPSEGTERLDGVAFDLPAGTETPGMPVGISGPPTRMTPRLCRRASRCLPAI